MATTNDSRSDSPRGRRAGSLGLLGVAVLLVVAVTGTVLAPSTPVDPAGAWSETVALAEGASRLGGVRDLHRWTAEALVVLAFLHLLRVFLAGSYREPRSGNWVIGVGLLAVLLLQHALGLGFPGNRSGRWALVALGLDPDVGGWPPGLVFVLHCFVLPGAIAGLVAVHWRRARRDGGQE